MQVRCLHCHEPMEVADESDLSRLLCPCCGGTFSLVDQETVPYSQESVRRLGRFELLERVGGGSFGTVWKARDRELDRTVAVKVPRGDQLSPHEAEQFLREARAAAQLHHPHIVSVHEVGRDDKTLYIVSDFVQGTTLGNWLTAHRLAPREAASLCIDIADALHHAHEQGVIHRDVKPSNIMLTPPAAGSSIEGPGGPPPAAAATDSSNWVPMLMDFGLARRTRGEATVTLQGRIMGTPAYMSPEQARGEAHSADRRTDIYSLGVVLFRMLTGELPFRGNAEMLTLQILREEPPSPRKFNHRLARDLDIICLKCMEKEPARRYQTARELADDLLRFLKGEPIQARPVGRLERLGRWVKRQPAAAALVLVSALAALALVGVAVGSFYHFRLRDAHERTQGALHGESVARTRAEQAQRDEEQQRRRAELFQYFHHIAVAHAEWRDGSFGRVEALLDECVASARNWEWRYLKRLCHSELLTLRGHSGWVFNVYYSPDGTRLASTGEDNSIRVWNASTGQLLMTLKGRVETTSGFAFSPDGTRIATTEEDQTIRFWHATRGEPIGSLPGAKGAVLTFSPNGKLLALLNSDQQVEVWDLASSRRVLALKTEGAYFPTFSPDGSRFLLVRWGNLTVEVWDVSNDREPVLTLKGHTGDARNAAFSPDGKVIATCSYDQTVRLWDATTGRELHTIRSHTNEVTCVAFSPDGRRVASAGMDQTVRVHDVATGRELLTFKGHTRGAHGVAFSPDGTRIASASLDQTVKVWDAMLAPEALIFPGTAHDFRYVSLAFDRENHKLLWAGSDGTARVWDMVLGQEVSISHEPAHVEAVFSNDGKRMAVARADGSIEVLNAPGRADPSASPLFSLKLPTGASRPLAFSADGLRLATISAEGVISISELATRETTPSANLPVVPIRFDRQARRQIGFSQDLTKVVLAEKGGPYQVWDVNTGQAIASLGVGPLDDLPGLFVFSADGARIAGRIAASEIALWDAATGDRQVVLEGHYHLIMCLAFSPDGTRLASAGWDRTVKVWDTETGHEAISFQGHPRAVTGLAFSADGNRLASASFDGTVRVADARPWTPDAPAEREALGLVHFFFARPLCRDDVLGYLRHLPVTHPQARDKALALAQRFRESADPQAYHEAAWAIVRQPYSNPFQYGFALKQAETARRLAPDENRYRTALGLAQYRAGNFAEAVLTFTEADKLEKDVPANLAFLALSHHRLGQEEQAKATLARLRETLNKIEGPAKEETLAFLREAEAQFTPTKP